MTDVELRERTWRQLVAHRRVVREIVDKGVDPSNPQHIVVARVCALWVIYSAQERKEAAANVSSRGEG